MSSPRRPPSPRAAFLGAALSTSFVAYVVVATANSGLGFDALLRLVLGTAPLSALIGLVAGVSAVSSDKGSAPRRTVSSFLFGGLLGLWANVVYDVVFGWQFDVWSLPDALVLPVSGAFGLSVGTTMRSGFDTRRMAVASVTFLALVPATLLAQRAEEWLHAGALGPEGDSIAVVTIVQVDASAEQFSVGRGADLLVPADLDMFAGAGLVGEWRVASLSVHGSPVHARRVLLALHEPVTDEIELEQPGSDPVLYTQVAGNEFRLYPADAATVDLRIVLSDRDGVQRRTHAMSDLASGASSGGTIANWGAKR